MPLEGLPHTVIREQLDNEHNWTWLAQNGSAFPWVNVKDEGAKGDGAADDTSAFGVASTTAGEGGWIYVPPGTYILNYLQLNVDNQRWTLAPGAVLKLKNPSSFGIIIEVNGENVILEGGEYNGDNGQAESTSEGLINVRASGVHVRDAYFHDGDGIGVLVQQSAGGVSVAVNNVTVSDCGFLNCANGGVFVSFNGLTTATTGHRILNCWSDNSALGAAVVVGGGFGMYGSDTVGDRPTGCVISGCYAKSRRDATTDCAGMGYLNVNNSVISDCYAESQSLEGFVIAGRDLNVADCTSLDCEWGVECNDVSGAVTGCTLDANNGTSSAGVVIISAHELAVTGNTLRNFGTSSVGIGLDDTGTPELERITISGNTIEAAEVGIGFNCTDGGNHILISGNRISTTTGATRYGIRGWFTTTKEKNLSIMGNLIEDASGGAAVLIDAPSGAPTLSNVRVRNNEFLNCAAGVTVGGAVTIGAGSDISGEGD